MALPTGGVPAASRRRPPPLCTLTPAADKRRTAKGVGEWEQAGAAGGGVPTEPCPLHPPTPAPRVEDARRLRDHRAPALAAVTLPLRWRARGRTAALGGDAAPPAPPPPPCRRRPPDAPAPPRRARYGVHARGGDATTPRTPARDCRRVPTAEGAGLHRGGGTAAAVGVRTAPAGGISVRGGEAPSAARLAPAGGGGGCQAERGPLPWPARPLRTRAAPWRPPGRAAQHRQRGGRGGVGGDRRGRPHPPWGGVPPPTRGIVDAPRRGARPPVDAASPAAGGGDAARRRAAAGRGGPDPRRPRLPRPAACPPPPPSAARGPLRWPRTVCLFTAGGGSGAARRPPPPSPAPRGGVWAGQRWQASVDGPFARMTCG